MIFTVPRQAAGKVWRRAKEHKMASSESSPCWLTGWVTALPSFYSFSNQGNSNFPQTSFKAGSDAEHSCTKFPLLTIPCALPYLFPSKRHNPSQHTVSWGRKRCCGLSKAETGFSIYCWSAMQAVPQMAKDRLPQERGGKGKIQAGRFPFWHWTSALLGKMLTFRALPWKRRLHILLLYFRGGKKIAYSGRHKNSGITTSSTKLLSGFRKKISEKQQVRVMLQMEERETKNQRIYMRRFQEQKNYTGNRKKSLYWQG